MSSDDREGWWRRATPAQRLRVMSVPLGLCLLGIGTFHALDARKQGESLWPVLLGLLSTVLIVVGVLSFVRRPIEGVAPADAMRMRSHQILKWAAPAVLALAILALIAQVLFSR